MAICNNSVTGNFCEESLYVIIHCTDILLIYSDGEVVKSLHPAVILGKFGKFPVRRFYVVYTLINGRKVVH